MLFLNTDYSCSYLFCTFFSWFNFSFSWLNFSKCKLWNSTGYSVIKLYISIILYFDIYDIAIDENLDICKFSLMTALKIVELS